MVLTAVLPLLATLQGPGDCAPEARVFVLAGQSNMAGLYAFEELLPPGLAAPQADVALWDGGASAPGWKPLAPGSGVDFGPELSLGRALADASPEDQVFLIKYAQGSTALHDDWAPPAGPEWLGLQATVASALGELTQAGIPFELGGMFWMQGEGDAVDGMGAAYEANLRAFVDQVRLDLASPDLPFVLGRILEGWGDPFNDQAVRAAQVAVGTTTPWATWVDTDDLSALGGHYDADGQVHLGERFAEALRSG